MERKDDDEDSMMVNFEIEAAAQALAELGRCCSSQPSQDSVMDIQHTCGYTSNTITDAGKYTQCSAPDTAAGYQSNLASKLSQNSDKDRAIGAQQCTGKTLDTVPENREKVIPTIPSQSCSASNKSNAVGRAKRNTNEAEKEARRLRRVMANRESARQTIRRRQAMYLELSRKAADLSEENVNLKKEKEIAVKHYNSLKDRNKFLKAQVSKIKESERHGKQKEPNSSQTEMPSSAPMFYHNQHPVIPYFWPSIRPSSDVFQYHCASHPDAMSSAHLMPSRCQGQENAGTPFFVLPVPWLLPFHTHGTTLNANLNRKDETPPTQLFSTCSSTDSLLHEDNIRLSLDLNVEAEVSDSSRSMSMNTVYGAATQFTSSPVTVGRNGNFQANVDANAVSASTEHMVWSKKNCAKKPEDSFMASEARRKRKELMKLKNVH